MLPGIALGATLILVHGGASSQTMPVPPCAGEPYPAAGAVGDSLNQIVWIDDEVADGWSPPACTAWTAGPSKALLAAAGRFRLAGDTAALAARLAEISGLADLTYWSSSRRRWRNLFSEAVALSGPDRDARRDDFVESDLVAGAELHYWLEEDNPTAGVVYRLTVRERAQDLLVYEVVNVTPLRAQLLFFRREVAGPGEFRQLYYIERESDDVWHYYTLIRMDRATGLAGTSAANYQNRAEAYFRHLAGIEMTREPPAAR